MRWKWILGICVAVIIAVFVTAYIILLSYDFNKFKPQLTDLAKQYTGRDLILGGDLELGLSLFPTVVVNDVTFQNASWGSRPQMAQVKRLEIQLALLPIFRGDIHVSRLTAVNPDFLIEIDKSGKSNLEFDVPQKPEPKAVEEKAVAGAGYFPEFKEVQIEGGTVTYNDHRSGRTDAISIDNLKFKAPTFGATAEIDVKFAHNKIPFKIGGDLGQLSAILNPDKQWLLNITIEALDSTVSIEGHITNIMEFKGIDLKLSAKGEDIANFQQVIGEPLTAKGPFDLSGHLTAPTLADLKISNIAVLLGESKIRGEFGFNQKSSRPQINASFQSQKLDLRPFLKQANSGGKTEAKDNKSEAKSDKVFSAKPFDFQALHQIDAAVSFRADQILGHRFALDKFHLDLSLKNGHLIIKPLTTNIGGGDLSGSLDLLAKGNHVSLDTKITASKIDFGEMLKKLEITQDLDGNLDVYINLTGQGKSEAALMAGLNGDVVVILSEGKLPVAYLNLVGADITDSLLKIVNPFEEQIKEARINCAVCDFNIKDGLAKSDVIMIDDPDKTILSIGTINLKTEELDFFIHTKPGQGFGTKETGKLSVSLSDITKPFKLGGTLANPSLGISAERTLKTAALALLGPAGWAYLFGSGSIGKQRPCDAALKIAGEGTPRTAEKPAKEKEQKGTSAKKGGKAKSLFSNPKK